MNRRTFIKSTAIGTLALGKFSYGNAQLSRKAPLCYFTKELQWLSYEDLGMVINELGFDGIDLTLRKGGSIEPENAAKELPKLAKALAKYNVSMPMIASNIADVNYPNIEEFFKAISDNGIKYYRMAYLKYDKTKSIDHNLEQFHQVFQDLSELNEKYEIAASYQNHDGTALGASIWDLAIALKGVDKKYVGSQFDIRHAVVEGGRSWPNDFAAIKDYINTIVTKDFHWRKNEIGKWIVENVPMGEGMVDFESYFKLYHEASLDVPMTNHTEYPIFNEDQEHLSSKEKIKIIMPLVRKDIEVIKRYL